MKTCVIASIIFSSVTFRRGTSTRLCADAFSVSHIYPTAAPPVSLHARKIAKNENVNSRRGAIHGIVGTIVSSSCFAPMLAAQAAVPTPLQSSSGTPIRVEEIGSGLDLLTPRPLSSSDALYPSSMINTSWKVQRVVSSVDGDLGQAALAWKLLGGSDERAFTSKLTEVYDSPFIAAPETMKDASYEYENKVLQAAISDRAAELSSRIGSAVKKEDIQWWGNSNTNKGSNTIDYTRNDGSGSGGVNLTIVQRKIEPPSDNGFGSDEIYRIQSSAGGIFGGTDVYRAARVRRRFRRGFDEFTGNRILDCIEIVTTYRVMDGVAGIEFPTSTCKSRLLFTQL